MSTKCGDDYITPMFVAVDELATGEVIITCDIGMKPEAEAFLSHFGVYVAYIFGSVVWEAFTVAYKMQMSDFQFCPIKGCAVEIDNSTVGTTESTDIEFAKCGLSEDLLIIPEAISFDPKTKSLFIWHPIPMASLAMKMETLAPSEQIVLTQLSVPSRRPSLLP